MNRENSKLFQKTHKILGCFCKEGYVRNGEKCQREDRCPTNNQDSNIWNDAPNMPGMKVLETLPT